MAEMTGTITIVQESRFQLMDEQGAFHLFLLSPHAAAEPAQLSPLVARQARVRVRFEAADNLVGFLAETIEADEPEASA